MPRIPYCCASGSFSSTSTLASTSAPSRAAASRSSVGPSIRQGPHQAAQKSTTTGSSCERASTSCSKVSVVTSIAVSVLSWSVGQRRAAAGVEAKQRVERAEADRACGEHDRREDEQHDSRDRAATDGDGNGHSGWSDQKAAKGAVEVAHIPVHLASLP